LYQETATGDDSMRDLMNLIARNKVSVMHLSVC